MNRIPKELEEKEDGSQPVQEFRVRVTVRYHGEELVAPDYIKKWLLVQTASWKDCTVEVTAVDEHLNRGLDIEQFTEDELYQAFINGGEGYLGKPTILDYIRNKRKGIRLYWNNHDRKVIAYWRKNYMEVK
jgi:hypothetical protein